MLQVLICICFLLLGCASDGNRNKLIENQSAQQPEEILNSLLSVVTNPQEMFLVAVVSLYHQKTSKWPEKIEDFKTLSPDFFLNNISIPNGSVQDKEIAFKEVEFISKDNGKLLVKYIIKDDSRGNFILRLRQDSKGYEFCSIKDASKECNYFLPVSMTVK